MISVAIIDDQRDISEGLFSLINKHEDLFCSALFRNAETALPEILTSPPDLIIIDLQLPGLSGLECIKRIKQDFPNLNILVYTELTEDQFIFQAFQLGASGYLTKTQFLSSVVDSIIELLEGGAPMSPVIAKKVVGSFKRKAEPIPGLSKRELEVLQLLCQGKSYRYMAKDLFVSTNTIRFHLKNIYKKLQVNSRYEAVAKASEIGFAPQTAS